MLNSIPILIQPV